MRQSAHQRTLQGPGLQAARLQDEGLQSTGQLQAAKNRGRDIELELAWFVSVKGPCNHAIKWHKMGLMQPACRTRTSGMSHGHT